MHFSEKTSEDVLHQNKREKKSSKQMQEKRNEKRILRMKTLLGLESK